MFDVLRLTRVRSLLKEIQNLVIQTQMRSCLCDFSIFHK